MCRHWTIAAPCDTLLEAKGSKFYAFAWHCSTPEQALQQVAGASDPKASHNCFAYKIGDEFRSTDDGEPGGTAGRPMLNAIETEELDEVCVLVIRFFGGTKLGAGDWCAPMVGLLGNVCKRRRERLLKQRCGAVVSRACVCATCTGVIIMVL